MSEKKEFEEKFSVLKKKYVKSCKDYYLTLEKLKKISSEREKELNNIRSLQLKYKKFINIEPFNTFNEDDFINQKKNKKNNLNDKTKKIIKDIDSSESSE